MDSWSRSWLCTLNSQGKLDERRPATYTRSHTTHTQRQQDTQMHKRTLALATAYMHVEFKHYWFLLMLTMRLIKIKYTKCSKGAHRTQALGLSLGEPMTAGGAYTSRLEGVSLAVFAWTSATRDQRINKGLIFWRSWTNIRKPTRISSCPPFYTFLLFFSRSVAMSWLYWCVDFQICSLRSCRSAWTCCCHLSSPARFGPGSESAPEMPRRDDMMQHVRQQMALSEARPQLLMPFSSFWPLDTHQNRLKSQLLWDLPWSANEQLQALKGSERPPWKQAVDLGGLQHLMHPEGVELRRSHLQQLGFTVDSL